MFLFGFFSEGNVDRGQQTSNDNYEERRTHPCLTDKHEAWMHASCLLVGLYRLTLRMDRITLNEAAAAAAMGGWCCAMTELGNAMDRGFYMSNSDEALVACGCCC